MTRLPDSNATLPGFFSRPSSGSRCIECAREAQPNRSRCKRHLRADRKRAKAWRKAHPYYKKEWLWRKEKEAL